MGNQMSTSVSNTHQDQSQKVTAGGNVTYATYNVYGDAYASASTAAKFDQDPKPFTDSAVDMSKVALASPSVEECGYSDRLMQLTLGNSTITTQESAHTICAYGRWPERLSAAEAAAIDMPTYPDVAVNRFYTLASVDWTTTSTGWFWRFPGVLKDVGLFGQNMHYHYLQRSGFAIHVQCNASRFHQGLLLVAWIPEWEFITDLISGADDSGTLAWADRNAFPPYYEWRQLTIFPHQFINLRTNNSSTIIVPYINCVPMDTGIMHNNGALLVIPLVDLSYSAGASTAVGVTLTVAPMAAEYNGLRFAIAQGVRVRNLPGAGQFLTTECYSAPPSFPHFQATNELDIPGEVLNLLDVAKIPTFMAWKEDRKVALDVTTTAAPGAKLYSSYLDFAAGRNDSGPFRHSYLGQLTRYYAHWSGSVRISLMFTGTAMTTAKFILCYTPPGGREPADRQQAMLGTHIIWDVGLQSSVDMIIPWICASQYRQFNQGGPYGAMGVFSIFYQTRVIVPPDAPTTAQIVGFVSACDDFAMRLPKDYVENQGPIQITKAGASVDDVQAPLALAAPQPSTSGELVTTNAPALNAVESGSGEDTQPQQVMETRAVTFRKSMLETSVEAFLARSALATIQTFKHQLDADGTVGTTNGYTTWPVDVHLASNLDLKRKMRMFTYVRCDFEFTILVTTSGVQVFENLRYQAMYCPPGARVPDSQASLEWQTATNPSVFFSASDPPASFSVPFMSMAAAYAMFYDGYDNFTGQYGRFPPNDAGTLAVRVINKPTTVEVDLEVRVYVKPKHVRCWVPRPIPVGDLVTSGPFNNWASDQVGLICGDAMYMNYHLLPEELRHRAKFQSVNLDLAVLPVREQMRQPWNQIPNCTCMKGWYYSGRSRRVQAALITRPMVHHFKASQWYPEHDQLVHLAEGPGQMGDCGNVLYCRHGPIGMVTGSAEGLVAFIPLRLVHQNWAQSMEGKRVSRMLPLITSGKTRGVAVGGVQVVPTHTVWKEEVVLDLGSREVTVVRGRPGLMPVTPAICDCHAGMYYSHKTTLLHYVELTPPSLQRFMTPQGERYRCGIMTGDGPAQPGDCGQPIFCGHGCFGMLVGGDELTGRVAFADIRDVLMQYHPVEQGICDFVRGLGSTFGDGFVQQVQDAVTGLKDTISDMLPSWMSLCEVFIQLVAALGICIKHSDEPATIAAVLALLGCSHTAPFAWLKQKICGLVGIRFVPKQGDNWLKKFTEAVNAFKAMDWLGNKIEKFVEWLKSFVVPACKEKTLFLERLKTLPALKDQIEQLRNKGAQADVASLQRMAVNLEYFKKYCEKYAPLYAVEAKVVRECEKILQSRQVFARDSRPEPVAIVLRGPPGCGKSLISTLIGKSLARKLNSSVYSLPPDPKYFDGYEGQAVCVMDDVGQNPDGEDLKYFCQMVSTTDFHPPMADLGDKGISFSSEFVVATTNLMDFKPVTVSEPRALARRFFLDLTMSVKQGYSTGDGRLCGHRSCQLCDNCNPKNFDACNALICGKAVTLQGTVSKQLYTVDDVVTLMLKERQSRRAVGNMLAAVLQGNEFYDELDGAMSMERPAPDCINDLLASVRSPEVIEYCQRKGWVVQERISRDKIQRDCAIATTVLQSCAALIAVCSAIYVCFKLYYHIQGPYTGLPQHVKKVPTLREVSVQGPNLDFAVSLLQRNMCILTSDFGEFSCLGVCDNLLVIPSHAFSDDMKLNGVPLKWRDAWSIHGQGAKCELTILDLDRNEKFRDIRKYIPEEVEEHTGCCVVINTARFPRMFLPVGNVSPTQNILLSGVETERVMSYNYPTKSGQCGGVVCRVGKVVGMHIGGNGAQGFCAALLRRYFPTLQGQLIERGKSKVRLHMPARTVLQPSVFHEVFDGQKEPAVLTKNDPRLKENFEDALFSKYVGNVEVDYKRDPYIQCAVDHYVAQLKTLDIGTAPLTTEEALFGYEGLDALDLATSAGYPYVTMGMRKRDFLRSTDPEGSSQRMEALIDRYGLNLPFVTYVKDELRSKEKVEKGKSRLIEASSLNDSVAMRRCFGRLYSKFHQNPGWVTGSAVGCDPDVFWSKIPCMMKEHLLCFDYTGYDASLSPVWFDALKDVLAKLGFGDGLPFIDYMCNSVHLMGGTRYVVNGGMPSGCSGTSIFNSMINNIIIRTLIMRTYKGIDLDELRMIAYGDDVIASYPYELDAEQIAKTGKTYGLTITPADKGAKFEKVTWANVTFLKRYFRADEKYPFLVHPVMPMKEIHESIRWTKDPTKTQEHVRSLCELAWHNGEAVYNEFCDRVRSVPIGKVLYLPAFATLYSKWVDKF